MKKIIVTAAIALAAAIGGGGSAEAQETKACPEWMRGLTMEAPRAGVFPMICKDQKGCKSSIAMSDETNDKLLWLSDMWRNLARMGVSKMRLCEYHRKYSW